MSRFDRRRFLGVAASGAGMLALSACEGAGVPGSTTTAVKKVDWTSVKPAASIEFWSHHPGKSRVAEQQIVDAWNASQSDTKVTLVTAGTTAEELGRKFQTAHAEAGHRHGLPSVILLPDVWWFRHAINDRLLPLDDILAAVEMDTSDYRDVLLEYQYKQQQMALPLAYSTPLFYYNRDMFTKSGATRAPTLWTDLNRLAPRLKRANPSLVNVYQHPGTSGADSWNLQNILWGWGGALSKDWNIWCATEPSTAAFTFLHDSVFKHRWAGVSTRDSTADFVSRMAAATVTSTDELGRILDQAPFDVGVATLPGGPQATERICPNGGTGLAIPTGIRREEQLAAAKFLKFVGNADNTALFARVTGHLPVRKSTDLTELVASRPQARIAIDQLGDARTQDTARVCLPGGDREIEKATSDILTEPDIDIKARLQELKETLEGIYTKEVKPKLG